MLVSDIVRRNAEFFPDNDAMLVPEVLTRTYAETEVRSNQVAHAFRGLGLNKGDRLAMFASSGPEYIEFFFACAKSGVIGAAMNIRLARSAREPIHYGRRGATSSP